jgi:hypothetical protein
MELTNTSLGTLLWIIIVLSLVGLVGFIVYKVKKYLEK